MLFLVSALLFCVACLGLPAGLQAAPAGPVADFEDSRYDWFGRYYHAPRDPGFGACLDRSCQNPMCLKDKNLPKPVCTLFPGSSRKLREGSYVLFGLLESFIFFILFLFCTLDSREERSRSVSELVACTLGTVNLVLRCEISCNTDFFFLLVACLRGGGLLQLSHDEQQQRRHSGQYLGAARSGVEQTVLQPRDVRRAEQDGLPVRPILL